MNYKLFWILRGLPGSGKSTIANELFKSDVIFEADKYFIDKITGEYKWDKDKLHLAHQWCQSEVEKAMQDEKLDICVSNTLTTEKELEPYINLAKKYDYTIISLIVENRHNGINKHGVGEETLNRMEARLKNNIKLK